MVFRNELWYSPCRRKAIVANKYCSGFSPEFFYCLDKCRFIQFFDFAGRVFPLAEAVCRIKVSNQI